MIIIDDESGEVICSLSISLKKEARVDLARRRAIMLALHGLEDVLTFDIDTVEELRHGYERRSRNA